MENCKKIVSMLIFLFFISAVTAQQADVKFEKDSSAVTIRVNIDKARQKIEDSNNRRQGMPLRIATNFPFAYKLSDIGTWNVLTGKSSKEWHFEMTVPGANGLIVRFSDFYIPPGGKLHIYNVTQGDYDAWTYTHEDNPRGGAYALEVFSQDNIVFEYVAPDSLAEKPRFETLNFGYKSHNELPSINNSLNACMMNVNCKENIGWQKQKMGIVLMRVNIASDTYLCTGSLINNTREDKKPYILTAQHCFLNNLPSDVVDTEFFFDYEFSGCYNSTQRPHYKYKKGATSLILNPMAGGSDGALISLNEPIPDDWTVYFNGWNLLDAENTHKDGVVLHHPRGDVKKISYYAGYLSTANWIYDGKIGAPSAHWLTSYSVGSTQGGSSGAPIFDEKGLIVGTLSGGDSQCNGEKTSGGTDLFGKMSYHWDKSSDTALHMKKYLDPDNTGVIEFGGRFNVEEKDLILSSTTVMVEETTSEDVYILGGNGGYTATFGNSSIATASIIDDTVRIEGHSVGVADITISDKLAKSSNIEVTVTEMEYRNLILDESLVVVSRNGTAHVRIVSGNGNYTLSVADPSIAGATISDNTIEIKGLKIGSTELVVTDRSRSEAKVSIRVRQEIEMYHTSGRLIVRINNDEELIDWITISDLSGREVGRFGNIGQKEYSANVSNIPFGAYIVMMKTKNNKKVTRKVAW